MSMAHDDSADGWQLGHVVQESFRNLWERVGASSSALLSSALVGLFAALAWNTLQTAGGPWFEGVLNRFDLAGLTPSQAGGYAFWAVLLLQVLGALKLRGGEDHEHL